MSVSDRALAIANQKQHDELCKLFDTELRRFLTQGETLRKIKSLAVYKETHKTFEAFVQSRFGMDRTYAHRLIDAAEVNQNLLPIVNKIELPQTESQYREVAKAPPEMQAEVVKKAAEKAAEENRKPTAADYKKVVGELVIEPEPDEKPKPHLPMEEQIKAERKKAKSYAEYLQRSIDDLNHVKPNKAAHADLIKWCGQILGGLERW